ncbi:alpha/beta fold hydrolase [Sediminimonas sp.]|uniref:alpha/beta hydrolase n=1 Tax=Sediminimonas sp. TaxID=2823379 RepID=UPI0025D9CBC4|nr:alpha/beta fold hydrolase [Sediminimonas sp.]
MLRKSLILVALLLLAACVDRTRAPVMPAAAEIGTVQPVLTATLRKPDPETGWFGAGRADKLRFLALDVSIPPEHRKGRISNGFDNPDPRRDFTISAREDLPTQDEFLARLGDAIAQKPADARDIVLYVHGYNNTFFDGVYRTAQIAHDFDLPGVAVHYSWPSAANPLGYTYDRDSTLFARDGFERLLRALARRTDGQVVVVGHSLGTMLVMETLRQIDIADPGWSQQQIGGVLLISPDLDIELFKTQADRLAGLPQPFAIFVSSRDRALQLSARINGAANRLGNLADPEVLSEYPVTLIDVSEFTTLARGGHFTVGTSPVLISLLNQSGQLRNAFQKDRAAQAGLLPGTAITVKNATQLILSPHLILQN